MYLTILNLDLVREYDQDAQIQEIDKETSPKVATDS